MTKFPGAQNNAILKLSLNILQTLFLGIKEHIHASVKIRGGKQKPLFNLTQNGPVGICRVLFLNSTFQNLLDFSFVRCHNLIPIQKSIKMSFQFRSSISREWKIKDFKDDIASLPLA